MKEGLWHGREEELKLKLCRQTKWSESVHNDKGILWPGLAVGRRAFVSVSTGGCATIGGKSGLTRLSLSLFGHRGTDSGVDLALPERAGCVRHVCASTLATNKLWTGCSPNHQRSRVPTIVLPLSGTSCCDNVYIINMYIDRMVVWV